jgi:hypothetical protein
LDESRLVYVGQIFSIRLPCFGCLTDTIRIGQALTILDADAASEPTAVPTTQRATGAAVSADGGALLYTLEGSSRVFSYTVAEGQFTTAHDFGAAGIARDVHVSGSRMAAVVGGRIALAPDAQFGQVQWDSGGIIHVVDLDSGSEVVLDAGSPRLYRRPVLSPAGDQLVAEGYPLIIGDTDTTVSRSGDLYRFENP